MSLRGVVEAFPLDVVLQLLAATEKTGQLEVRGRDEEQRGFLGVSGGRLVSARSEDEDGYLALGAVFAIGEGDLEFLPQDRVEREDLSGEVEDLLERAAAERDRVLGVRVVIAGDHVRFRLSERAAERGQVTLAPAQWKALLLVDGERDVAAIAQRLEMRRLAARQLLADLVRGGLIDTVAPPPGMAPGPGARLPPMGPLPPTDAGERVVLRGKLSDFPLETIVQLIAATLQTGRLEVHAGPDSSALGLAGGRLVSATDGDADGELVLGVAFTAREGEFEFVQMAQAPAANLTGELDALLDRAAAVRDRIAAVREVIPDERARFVLSERATSRSEIVLTPEQWRVLLGVNGERDVMAVAEQVRMKRMSVMVVLADLVRGGYVDVLPPREEVVRAREEVVPAREEAQATVAPAVPPWVAPELVAPPVAAAPPPEEAAWLEAVQAPAPETPLAGTPLAETPLAETPLDVKSAADDRLAALAGLFGPAQPAPPPPAWEPPPAAAPEQASPAWGTQTWEVPAPAAPEVTEIDPRLAAFGAPTAEPEAPAAAPAPAAGAEAEAVTRKIALTQRGEETVIVPAVAPAPPPEKKSLFGGLLGAKAAPAPAPPMALAGTRPGQLASFANELVAAYNSGQYGKARVEDRMLSLIMRADEQADPIDRALPIANDRLDVGSIDRSALPERQALPYLAVLVRQIYDDAERALGKDKARRGFRDVRDRVFGKDLTLLHAPEVSGRMPKV